jgi:hypothetical protein
MTDLAQRIRDLAEKASKRPWVAHGDMIKGSDKLEIGYDMDYDKNVNFIVLLANHAEEIADALDELQRIKETASREIHDPDRALLAQMAATIYAGVVSQGTPFNCAVEHAACVISAKKFLAEIDTFHEPSGQPGIVHENSATPCPRVETSG